MLSTNSCQELENQFCGFSFSSATFSTDDATLVSLSSLHEVIGIVGNGKDVGRSFTDLFILVLVDVSLIIDG